MRRSPVSLAPPAVHTGGRGRGWSTAFAGLFFLTVSCRGLLIVVVPVKALALLGTPQAVSLLYVAAGAAGICSSLLVPALVLRLRTRGVFHLAAGASFAAPVLLAMPGLPLFLAGMLAWVFGIAAFEVVLSLYTMHHFRRRELGLFEPRRVLFMVAAYCVGPSLGVYVQKSVGAFAPFALATAAAAGAVAYFHCLGLREAGAGETLAGASNPVRHVRRYAAQPRLRLAWAIAVARSGWWSTFFIYAPIYAVVAGLGDVAGGAIVSAGVAMVFTVTLWGRAGRRYGLRRLLVGGFALSGIASLVVAVSAGSGWLGAGLLVLAALCAAAIDGAGNVPFLRAVHPWERREMAGVFATYKDVAQLMPTAIAAVVLRVLPVPAVFGAAGLWMLGVAWLCRHVPRRL